MINGSDNRLDDSLYCRDGQEDFSNDKELLRVEDLCVAFRREKKPDKVAVNHISFSVKEGEILGIAGESGSGKSMTALAVMGLLPESAKCSCETVLFAGQKLLGGNAAAKEQKKEKKEGEALRRKLSGSRMTMIFQEPLTSLNPVLTIRTQMEEPLLLHTSLNKEEREQAVLDALAKAELKNGEQLLDRYPHQLSGGMRQRVMIAMAMINKPQLLIADEPTTALDAVTEREIVELIRRLAKENHTSVLFISHDLSVLRELCDRVMIMRDGIVVEEGTVEQIFENPERSYTKRLMAAAVKGPKETVEKVREKENETMLLADRISVVYRERRGLFQKVKEKQAVKQVSFAVQKGEIFGIVGESGCGKSTLLKVLSGLFEAQEGSVSVQGKPLWGEKKEKRKAGRKKTGIQMVFQDPYTSLNPAKKVGWILEEPLRLNTTLTEEERKERVIRILEETELPEDAANRYVAELSGGQRQRVAIAAALITNPELVLLDEPVSALDVTVQAQILELLLRLQKEHHLTYVFVSHDMAVVRKICDRVMVMKDGKVVECGATEELFLNPKEEYTRKLLGRK